jgi:hypothetical protein
MVTIFSLIFNRTFAILKRIFQLKSIDRNVIYILYVLYIFTISALFRNSIKLQLSFMYNGGCFTVLRTETKFSYQLEF